MLFLTHVLHMPAVDLVICWLKAHTGNASSLLKAYLCKKILMVTCNLERDQENHQRRI